RLYHSARFGHDAENPMLASMFLGYPWLVRGYDSGSFTVDECETGDCAEFDRLLGSRLVLANAELRLPLVGPFGLLRTYVFPPIEIAGFYDVGAAWRQGEPSPFQSGGRDPVSSHGVALRVNLFSFVLEANLVHPNDRPRKGWYWQLNLQPGF
ncbi:MAG TPA: BamA/TamA family outer membrane protein, partial [Gemmatimonadales bacterium]|nr:BamA/TamA family outer membrane protein [Gemmatimonadales bacterium]